MERERIDILNRTEFVDNVFTVIETLSKNRMSRTFAINGEWGSGKSFVLDMLEEKLEFDNNYMVFHYNCWQYDYYEEPLKAIVSSMYDWIKANENDDTDYIKNLLIYSIIAFGLTSKELAKNLVEKITTIDFSKISKEAKEKIESINAKGKIDDELSTVQESIMFTRDLLSSIAKEKTVVVVVDELDRCLPEYAIKVLERLHHLFDGIDNLIVILAVDKSHLNNTVSQIFGFDKTNITKDINSYLAKFIDFEIQLDKGIVDDRYGMKYNEYVSKFVFSLTNNLSDEFVSKLLSAFSGRERSVIFEKAYLIHNMVFDDDNDNNTDVDEAVMCVELLWVVFANLYNGEFPFDITTFLPRGINNTLSDFSEFFKAQIKKKVTMSQLVHPISGATVEYIINSNNNLTCEKIMYLCSFHPFFNAKVSLKSGESFDCIVKKLKKFAELITIIK